MNNTSLNSKEELEFDPSIPEDERRFYLKAYTNVNHVRERKVHCTICKMHIGTAPCNESIIRMHPILRVTHCKKCHDFYNSGEFSKGEDGSELYCRWCGQGGEVYCCSNCPFVFCKSCIISNLSRGVVADIEQNENWSCFNCAPKMLWPLRAQHWALIKFIDKQKKAILNSNLSDAEIKVQMTKDRSLCCKIKKPSGYGTDSSDSSDISLSRLKKKVGEKRSRKSLSKEDLTGGVSPAGQAKRAKGNDEVVCTPDVMSMLEPECTLTVPSNAKQITSQQPSTPSPKIMSIQPAKPLITPPLLIRSAPAPVVRPPAPVLKKTVVAPRVAGGPGTDFNTPVYHTINGYRIDLNSAAQQETVRLPNGKLIQVKRQGTGPQAVTTVQSGPNQSSTPNRIVHNISQPALSPIATVPAQQIVHSSGGHIIRSQLQTPRPLTIQNGPIVPQFQQHQQPSPVQQQFQQITIRQPNQQIATIRYQGNTQQQMNNMIQNGTMQILNGTQVTAAAGTQIPNVRQLPTFIKQFFPNTPLGQSRTQLQNQIFNAMEICQHLMGKLQTLTNSNAYKTAKSMTDVKELYIHLSYLLTYAIGRFKGLQDNCLSDMRDLGFTNDANSLENGQLAAEKQASDAEEDEISIVEPQTDTINLDSDNEDDLPPPKKPNVNIPTPSVITNTSSIAVNNHHIINPPDPTPMVTPTTTTNADDELTAEYDFSNVASLLAGMLEVELTEGGTDCIQPPKKPRKKTTNKPNPTLVKQKEMQERERLENIKKNCSKLKMEVQIPLNKVEDIYEYAKPMLEDLKQEKLEAEKIEAEEVELKKKEEEENNTQIEEELGEDEKKETASETDINKTNPEMDADDKEESEEVVVVLLEEQDNSKEDDETVELIDHDESQESICDPIQEEDVSVCPDDSSTENYKRKDKEDVMLAVGDKENEESKEEQQEKVIEKSKGDDEKEDVMEEEEETEVHKVGDNKDVMEERKETEGDKVDEEKEDVIEDEETEVDKEDGMEEEETEVHKVDEDKEDVMEEEETEVDKVDEDKEDVIEDEETEVDKEDGMEEEETEVDKVNKDKEGVVEEEETEVDKVNEDNEDEETEILIEPDNKKCSELPLATEDATNLDPLQADESSKELHVPQEITENNDTNVENDLESTSLSHNYSSVLGRTEVA